MAADRLCPSCVLADVSSDTGGGADMVNLPRVVALCDTEAMDPGTEAGRFLLVMGTIHETRKWVRLLAAFVEPAERKEIEHSPEAWVDQRITDVEDEIADWWGEPVADLIRQKREQPDFFDRVLTEVELDQEPCRSASM